MEVPVPGSDQVRWTQVRVPSQISPGESCCPQAKDAAGIVHSSLPTSRHALWRIHSSSPSTLEIFDLDDYEAHMSGLNLVFEEPLSQFLTVYYQEVHAQNHENKLCACVVTVSGTLYVVKIKTFYKYRNTSAIARSEMVQVSLTDDIQRLDQITSFVGLRDWFCIGGKNGSILCYPLGISSGNFKDQCFELRDSDPLLGRLWGLVSRAKTASPIQNLKIQLHRERILLFALHEDGTFRLWDLNDHSRLLTFNLYKGDITDSMPKGMWVQEHGLLGGSRQIAFFFQGVEATMGGSVNIYDLHLTPTEGSTGQPSLTCHLQIPCVKGSILDLKLLPDSFWSLEEFDQVYTWTCYSTKKNDMLESCIVLEDELASQLFQKSNDNWEDLILFQQSTSTSSKNELQVAIAEFFLSRIMQPGIFQLQLVRKVLEKFNRRISETDFSMLTRDGIRKEILTAVQAENTSDEKLDYILEWKEFCTVYFTLWRESNKPYALLLDYYTGNVGLIRRHSFSIKRSLSDFEKKYIEARQSSENSNNKDFWGYFFKCTTSISTQLGRMPVSTFGHALLGNKHTPVSYVLSVFLHLLDVGYDHSIFTAGAHFGVDSGKKKTQDYRQRHRKFEFQMFVYLQQLKQTVGSWNEVFENIQKYASQLIQDSRMLLDKDPSEGSEYGIISKRLVQHSVTQLSWTHFEAARDLFLLLGYILNNKGQMGINPNELTKVQMDLLVQVKKILLLNLLVHWLSINFAEVAPPEDFSLHLSTLQLDSVTSEKSNSRYIGAGEMTLAEILLSDCIDGPFKAFFLKSKGLLTSNQLITSAKAFSSWLMWGEGGDPMQPLSSRSVPLASTILKHGQYRALQNLLRIVDDICNEVETHSLNSGRGDWCACLHLMGCSLLGQTRNNPDIKSNETKVEKAVYCFFRVASAVGQEREDLHTFLLETGMQTSFPVLESTAAWKFQYFEWVMQIFEQNNVSGGACQFAYAALQEVDEAAKSYNMETLDLANAASVIKGRLWANIFKFSLDQKHFKEAYCAIISNPDKDSKFICLRRFLIVLCEQKATEVLCGHDLPYGGLLERVEQELVLKADYSDITANPNPFKILYSFHMQRNNWRRSALFMYLYYVRLKEIDQNEAHLSVTYLLQEQLNSLSAAINALHLVDPMYAWLDLEVGICGRSSGGPSLKRIRVYSANDGGQLLEKNKRSHVDLAMLENDYTLTLAQILLAENGFQLSRYGDDMSPTDLLSLLVQSGLYDMAFTLLFRFWKDSSLKSELERTFRIMTERWCSRHQDSRIQIPSSRPSIESEKQLFLLSSSQSEDFSSAREYSIDVISKDTSNNTMSNTLQTYLEKYTKLHPRLPVIVAETLLNIDRLMELPVWLVDMLKGGRQPGGDGMCMPGADPAALLRIYLDYGRISEAAILFMDYVKAWTNLPPAYVIKRKKMCGVWFPYMLVDRLRASISEMKSAEQFGNLGTLLDRTLQKHFLQVETDSMDVKSMVKCYTT